MGLCIKCWEKPRIIQGPRAGHRPQDIYYIRAQSELLSVSGSLAASESYFCEHSQSLAMFTRITLCKTRTYLHDALQLSDAHFHILPLPYFVVVNRLTQC